MEWKSITTNRRCILVILVVVLGVALVAAFAFRQFESTTSKLTVINGITVPPEPDPELNNATLEGIDVNGNGVRDDVERLIAKEFGDNPEKHADAMKFAVTQERMLIEGTDEAILLNSKAFQCSSLNSKDTNPITYLWANTEERIARYRSVLTGAPIRKQECEDLKDKLIEPSETINGIHVPPEPDLELNNATLAGIDSNENGVRDDVERAVASKFGGTADYLYAMAAAREYQNMLTQPTPATRDEALVQVGRELCAIRGASRAVYQFGFGDATANTDKRRQAERAFNDVLIGYVPQELPPCSE